MRNAVNKVAKPAEKEKLLLVSIEKMQNEYDESTMNYMHKTVFSAQRIK